MFHLAACSFPNSQSLVSKKSVSFDTSQQDTLLNDHQTNKFLTQWAKTNYKTDLPNQKVTFTNKHTYAKSFHKIISGFSISTFCHRTKGIGLPVVVQTAEYKFKPVTDKAYQSNLYPGTLVVTKSPSGDLNIILLDPRESRSCYGRPLKTQHNIVIDHVTNDPNNRALAWAGLINPQKFKSRQGFYLSRPYDKNKIPVIMIHGIFSSPKTFMDMAETIESEPDLYKKYQIWHYYYPTGTPWLATAHDFRTSFRGLIKKLDPQRTHTNLRKTVIIAHSMGGLITRLSLSEPKNHLSKAYLGELGPKIFTKDQHKRIHPLFHYKPLTEPKTIILLAVPHRGSRVAKGIVGWTMDKLIAIPNIFIKGTKKVLNPEEKSNLPKHTQRLLDKSENAVDQLQPDNPSLKALNQMKLPSHLKVHSLIGDIGLPAIRLYSDGVVSYRSAHLHKAGTETLIPSNHDITDDPKSVRRVMEILRKK